MKKRPILIENLILCGCPRLSRSLNPVCNFALSRAALVKVTGFVRKSITGKPVIVRQFTRKVRKRVRSKAVQKVFNQAQRNKSLFKKLDKTRIYPKTVEPRLSKTDLFGNKINDSVHKQLDLAVKDVYRLGEKANKAYYPQEFAYLMDRKTGGFYEFVKGEADRVKLPYIQPSQNLVIIHNHPNEGSLSLADFKVGGREGVDHVVAVGKGGNIYSGAKVKSVSADQLEKAYESEYGDFFYKLERINDRLLNNKRFLSKGDRHFLSSHAVNLNLEKQSLVHYKAQIDSPYHQKLWEVWQTLKNQL